MVDVFGLLAGALGQQRGTPMQGLMGDSAAIDPGFAGLLSAPKGDAHPLSVFDQAKEEFAVLRDLDIGFKSSPGRSGEFLEFWPAGEPGTPDRPRPTEFPIELPGVEVFDEGTRPIDIMGDIASHHLIETDPRVRSSFQQFRESLTPKQRERLRAQYAHSVQNFGEQRPFEVWRETSGLPAYFRGYAFRQWENPEELYTPGQIELFDGLMQYLRTGE